MAVQVKPSLTELALKSKKAMLMGVGGGGDVILTIPLANYFQLLGVAQIAIGGVSSQWWNPDGGSTFEDFVIGPLVYDVAHLTDAELLAPMVALVSPTSRFQGYRPAEAAMAELVPWETFVGGLTQGVAGLRDSLNRVIEDRRIDLFIGADIGAHSFHDGKETSPPFTTLISLMSLSAMIQLKCPVVYGFAGYAVDAEMEIEELDERVERIMRAGGYIGAYGLTQRDVVDYLEACRAFPDPIEPFVAKAAEGELGLKRIPVMSPWGRRAHVTPLSAVYLFLDPHTMVREVSTGVNALKDTRSMAEAEDIYQNVIGNFPETRVRRVVHFADKDPWSSKGSS